MRIVAQDLSVAFASTVGSRTARVSSLEIASGQAVCVTGASGTGKSTLLHLLSGVLRADRGSLRIGETDLLGLGPAERDRFRANHIAYVFQTLNLLGGLTAHQNVMLALSLRTDRDENAKEIANDWLNRLGLAGREHDRAAKLSVGEQQRVAFARALAICPAVLLADEPTASLDPAQRDKLLANMHEVRDKEGVTLVVVTHDPAVAQTFDDCRDIADVLSWSTP